MADVKRAFGTASQGMTCTVASLADGSARGAAAIDNGTNLFLDAMVYVALKLAVGTPASDKAIYVWFYGSEDGTNYTDNAVGTDVAITMRSPTNLRGPFVLNTPDAGALTYKAVIGSIAQYFGGVLPPKWGIVIQNKSGLALDATEANHTKEYRGAYATVL